MRDRSHLEIRRATRDDHAAILHLGTRTLGWLGDAEDEAFFSWKHEHNPFGPSPMWVACDGNRIVGFRTFLRWEFVEGGSRVIRAVRAVDTATDPEYQGRGIFTRLTLAALDELRDEGIEMVFNTPNDKSLPGYLKMGWRVVGRLPVSIMPTRMRSILAIIGARAPASRTTVLIHAGDAPGETFTDHEGIGLLATIPDAHGLRTSKSPEFFAWRYGHEPLQYRAVLAGPSVADGFAVFRLRRRGSALEAVLCDLVVSNPRQPEASRLRHRLARRVARLSGADYVLRIDRRPITTDPFVRVPRVGPVLTCRTLTNWIPPGPARWAVDMGDIELF